MRKQRNYELHDFVTLYQTAVEDKVYTKFWSEYSKRSGCLG